MVSSQGVLDLLSRFPCHPLNHLQRVVIKNFGPEDQIILQGRVYRDKDVQNGLLPGVPQERLRVELTPQGRI